VVSGTTAHKAARQVAAHEPIVLTGPQARFVSRGGDKLDAALERFGIDVTGRIVLDAGASTGGFTDCLVQRGARHVYAVDVGHGQIDDRLRHDARVSVLERVNVRNLTTAALESVDAAFVPCSLVTADLSFISLVTVLSALTGPISTDAADYVLLVKPQFEAGRVVVARGKGVVRDPAVWHDVLATVTSALVGSRTGIMGVMVSPLTGPAGNVEFLVHARGGTPAVAAVATTELIDQAVDAAVSRRDTPDGAR